MSSDWRFVKDGFPEIGRLVEATTQSGDVVELRFKSNLWWLPDYKMYVYFTPVKWRYK